MSSAVRTDKNIVEFYKMGALVRGTFRRLLFENDIAYVEHKPGRLASSSFRVTTSRAIHERLIAWVNAVNQETREIKFSKKKTDKAVNETEVLDLRIKNVKSGWFKTSMTVSGDTEDLDALEYFIANFA